FLARATAHTEFYTLSLHDALPISLRVHVPLPDFVSAPVVVPIMLEIVPSPEPVSVSPKVAPVIVPAFVKFRMPLSDEIVVAAPRDRKSTRLNSSHLVISYAVFCLK